MKHYGDITKLNGYELPIVNIITGGSPCQDLSCAGKRAGLAGERSGLFMEQIRIIKEMREHDRSNGRSDEHIRPRYMVWENVVGAFSSNKGEDFRCVLEETAKIVDENAVIPKFRGGKWTPSGCIVGNGWSIAWRVHDAQYWGVPQRRKRICLLADFNGDSAGRLLFELRRETDDHSKNEAVTGIREESRPEVQVKCQSMSGYSDQSKQTRKETAGTVGDSIDTASRAYTLKVRGAEVDSYGKKAGKGALVQTELSGTLGVSQDQTLFDFQSSDGDIVGTLDASYYKGYGEREGIERTVVYGISAYESNSMKSPNPNSGIYEADTTRTLDNNGGNPACNQGGMIVLEGNGTRESHKGDGYKESDISYTLNTVEQHAVCYRGDAITNPVNGSNPQDGDPCHTLTNDSCSIVTFEGKAWDGSDISSTLTANNANGSQRMPDKDNFNAVITYGLDRASFNQGKNAQYDFSVQEEVAQTLVAKGRGVLTRQQVPCVQGITKELETSMSRKEKLSYSIMPDITPKIDDETAFSLRSRDYKDPQIVCTPPHIYDARGNGDGKTVSTITGDHENRITDYTAVCVEEKEMDHEMIVRRLTPMECTRLQGYPDGWVDIGEWEDTKGKVHKDADSPKYKALGNSIALPFWQWIADRICKQYDYEPTMASLFSGIGGFELVFSRCGCKPVWCSEIEEFPIAVTKRHFPESED